MGSRRTFKERWDKDQSTEQATEQNPDSDSEEEDYDSLTRALAAIRMILGMAFVGFHHFNQF